MYYNQIDKHTYWIYDKASKRFICMASTKTQLYRCIRRYADINNIDYSGGDKSTVYDEYNNRTVYSRRYIIYDNNKIFDIRDEIDAYHKFTSYTYNRYKPKKNKLYNAVYGDKCKPLYIKYNNTYKFRQGAVPGIHRRTRYSKYFSVPKIGRHLRDWSDIEYRQYMRKPNLIKDHMSLWFDDFGYRGHSKSWKNNKKLRHQWEKNLRC